MPKRQYYAKVSKSLQKHNITWDQFRKNPASLMVADESFRKWMLNRHYAKDEIRWYTKKTSMSAIIKSNKALLTLVNRDNPTYLNTTRPELEGIK